MSSDPQQPCVRRGCAQSGVGQGARRVLRFTLAVAAHTHGADVRSIHGGGTKGNIVCRLNGRQFVGQPAAARNSTQRRVCALVHAFLRPSRHEFAPWATYVCALHAAKRCARVASHTPSARCTHARARNVVSFTALYPRRHPSSWLPDGDAEHYDVQWRCHHRHDGQELCSHCQVCACVRTSVCVCAVVAVAVPTRAIGDDLALCTASSLPRRAATRAWARMA